MANVNVAYRIAKDKYQDQDDLLMWYIFGGAFWVLTIPVGVSIYVLVYIGKKVVKTMDKHINKRIKIDD